MTRSNWNFQLKKTLKRVKNMAQRLIVEGDNEIHTWLAWQEEPGKPFGIALKAGYFDHQSPAADHFVDWFTQTFQFAA